ncbi:glycosyltransferase [Cupriavidus sp. WS]|uniref:glycosyltransferase n=1 Tax=Cupriavidus sp. WS TaxID=1312922 RepID=UPI0003A5D5DA|nr:glycosyltransferase [Cupriavidus sp. WS]
MNKLISIVYRHQLFKVSEPFIVQQASSTEKFVPVYLGVRRYGLAPYGAISLTLEDNDAKKNKISRIWNLITRDPGEFIKKMSGIKPNIIHAHFGVEGVYALPIAEKLGVPLVTTFHGFDATTNLCSLLKSKSPSLINYAIFRRRLMRRGAMFLCVSEYIKNKVLDIGFPSEKVHVHYIGIDVGAIIPREAGDEKFVILHVARLVEKKGTEYLLRAFSKISDMFPDLILVIIGDGPLRSSLENLACSLGVVRKVIFKGAQSHEVVLSEMRSAALFVLPSVTARSGDAEGLGMVLLEAAALGVPLIGTRHGGIPEVVIDGETGYLVPERDVAALAEGIRRMLSSPAVRAQMGRAARAMVESKFDIRRQAAKLEILYETLLL